MALYFDVVVLGAGPAGASAALKASEGGVSVLLVEKNREIGVPIRCGEYLPVPKEMEDLLPRAKHTESLYDVPEDMVRNRTSKIRIVSPAGKSYLFDLKAYVIDRSSFDKNLVRKAAERGAKVWTNAKALEIEKEGRSIRIRRGREEVRVETEVLVAADGSFSRTARSIGLDLRASPHNYSPVLQYVMENITVEDDVVEMYLGREYAPGGYTWIIPRGDGTANVGLGIRSPFYERGTTIHEFLQRFIRRHPAASSKLKEGIITSRVGGLMPVGGPIPKTATDDIMVVGDAAGHVMASNGGGVPPALVCGEIAGETAANRIDNGVCLSLYEEMWRSEVGEELNTSLKVREMGDLAMKSDDFMNGILEILGPKNIGEMIRCRLPLGLAQLYRLAMKVKRHL